MKNLFFILVICVVMSCDNDSDDQPSAQDLIGFWSRETVYLNEVNSNEYVDFLNNGTNFLDLKEDKIFHRAYDLGTWRLSGYTLTLDRDEPSGYQDWECKIVAFSKDFLVLELKLVEGKYCCSFDEFADDEIITIKEVYRRPD
jgi:hypothetical protein